MFSLPYQGTTVRLRARNESASYGPLRRVGAILIAMGFWRRGAIVTIKHA
ncbi:MULTISPECIES: hypothetical protein [unclassified Herbaspirillum]|nr:MULTISPECIES: hypothetical protein [unclassified Herbaspirillum]MBB5393042.1 hypothetical protein [Herbaspirillum sp. SJZ102]